MKKIKFIALALILTAAFGMLAFRNASAFIFPIPVTDASTLGQNVVNDIRLVLEAKITAETKRISGRLNSTIGNTPFDPHKLFEDGYISKGEDEGEYGKD